MKINSQKIVVCEVCEKPFEIGQALNFENSWVTDRLYDDPSEYKGFPVGESVDRTEQFLYHAACYQRRPAMSAKVALYNLTRQEQRAIYLFLHDALGHRL